MWLNPCLPVGKQKITHCKLSPRSFIDVSFYWEKKINQETLLEVRVLFQKVGAHLEYLEELIVQVI